ncbi:MAG: Dihydrolipoamide acetyltransferase [Polyangiaceae bacterium]|jgi:tetratricopeptide (TPR) repeat protein|nr:Dihydrolipoamide acetyltransferase [Polyangiaceae bacterium]
MFVRSCAALLSLSLSFAHPAFADAPSSEAAVESRRSAAKVKFQRGSELYEAGQYEKAVQAFMEADALAPSAPLSFNIARAYERLEDSSGALRWYRDYLRRSPRAPNATEVRARVAALSAKLAQTGVQQLTVVSMPVGASVIVDGRSVGVTPFTGDLALGKHRVSLDLPGYRNQTQEITLAPNAPTDLSSNLEPEAEPKPTSVPAASTDAVPDRGGGRRFGIAPWIVAGGGLATLGSALGFELARRSHETDAENAADQPTFQAETDAMQRDKTTARVLASVGGALFITGTVMLIINDKDPARSAPRVGVGCTFSGCTASARGTF